MSSRRPLSNIFWISFFGPESKLLQVFVCLFPLIAFFAGWSWFTNSYKIETWWADGCSETGFTNFKAVSGLAPVQITVIGFLSVFTGSILFAFKDTLWSPEKWNNKRDYVLKKLTWEFCIPFAHEKGQGFSGYISQILADMGKLEEHLRRVALFHVLNIICIGIACLAAILMSYFSMVKQDVGLFCLSYKITVSILGLLILHCVYTVIPIISSSQIDSELIPENVGAQFVHYNKGAKGAGARADNADAAQVTD